MTKTTESKLLELHEKMLKAQKDGGDFDLTIRDLMMIWGYPTSTSAARYHLPRMVELGLVKYRIRGTRHRTYRAVETATRAA
jgi:hypothetical protein